jgi:hypothetical protein
MGFAHKSFMGRHFVGNTCTLWAGVQSAVLSTSLMAFWATY